MIRSRAISDKEEAAPRDCGARALQRASEVADELLANASIMPFSLAGLKAASSALLSFPQSWFYLLILDIRP